MGGFDENWLKNYMRRMGKVGVKNTKIANVNEQTCSKMNKNGLKMNKTEARYENHVLRPALFAHEIKAYWFESFKLRLADRTWYTPDFVVQRNDKIEIVEIKGGFIRDDSMVKYKVAKEMYPCFTWKMMQYKSGEWRKIK